MGLFSSLFGGGKRKGDSAADSLPSEPAEIYLGLRNQVLSQWASDVTPLESTTKSLALLMETGYPSAVATLVAIADGTTSLYFSNGGGIIGSGEDETVRAAALSLLTKAGEFTTAMQPADSFPLPPRGSVRFHLITTNGCWSAEAVEDDLGYMRHPLSPLFHKGHEVITAIREHASRR